MENKSVLSNPYTFLSYVMVFFTIQTILVYILNLPSLITSQSKLVHEYYVKKFTFNIPFDFFLVLFYLEISLFLSRHLCTYPTILSVLCILIITTIIISGSFYLYFTSIPKTDSFFSRWFYAASWKAIIYDVIVLSVTLLSYIFLNMKLNTYSS